MNDSNDEYSAQQEMDMAIAVNNLSYSMDSDLSVAVNSTYKKHYFAQDEYDPNRSAICVLNSGADYLDFRRSYLSFDFELTVNDQSGTIPYKDATNFGAPIAYNNTYSRSDAAQRSLSNGNFVGTAADVHTGMANAIGGSGSSKYLLKGRNTIGSHQEGADIGFGNGSAANLINRITIQSRSGDEVCRIENSAMLSHILTNYCYSRDWAESTGSGFGMHPAEASTINGQGKDSYFYFKNVTHTSQTKKRFHIPLYLLTGFFNYERLMPSMLCSGLRISIEWNDAATALVWNCNPNTALVSGTNVSWKVSKVHIDAKSVQLTDASQRYLNEVSATSGLELVYTDYNHTGTNINGSSTEIHSEVRQACARALRAFARIRSNTQQKSPTQDSFAADYWMVPAYQWRLGSLYFPQQPTQAKNLSDWKDSTLAVDAEVLARGRPLHTQTASVTTPYEFVTEAKTYAPANNSTYSSLASWKFVTNESILDTNKSGPKHLDNVTEAYYHSLEMFGKLNGKSGQTSVSLEQFCEGDIPLVEGGHGVRSVYQHSAAFGLPKFDEGIEPSAFDGTHTDRGLANPITTANTNGLFNSSIALSRLSPQKRQALLMSNFRESAEATDVEVRAGETGSANQVTKRGQLTTTNSLNSRSPSMDLASKIGRTTTYGNYPGCQAIIPVSLERSTMFALSGVPINNSRVLGLDYQVHHRNFGEVYQTVVQVNGDLISGTPLAESAIRADSDLAAITATLSTGKKYFYPPLATFDHSNSIFLQYVKVARVFLNNVEIEQ